MTIAIRCSGCKAALGVPDSAAGSRVRCSGCGAILMVPAARLAPPPPPIPPPPPPAPPPPAVVKEAEPDNPFSDVGHASGNAYVEVDAREEGSFADVGAEKSVLARYKSLQRYRRPLGWRFFVTVGGAVACSWLTGVVVIGWGKGLAVLLAALFGSVAGSLCLGSFGALFGMLMWTRANQAARATKKLAGAVSGRPSDRKLTLPVKYLFAMMFAGFLLIAPFGALVGAVGGSSINEKPEDAKKKTAKQRQQDDQRLWYAVLAAGGGAILGAAPGAILGLLYRAQPSEEEQEKKKAKRSSRRRDDDD